MKFRKLDALRWLVPLAIAAACVQAHAGQEPDTCLKGEFVIGCESESSLDQIDALRQGRRDLQSIAFRSVSTGVCRVFRDGDLVVVTDRTFTTERLLVNRPGESKSYWVADTSTRPLSECGTAPVGTGAGSNQARVATANAAASARDRAAVKAQTAPQALAEASNGAAGCNFKPVMTDAEIRACRPTR